jgi:hypothetical protein
MYNILQARTTCPHCGSVRVVDIEFRFGPLDLATYRLGDTIPWSSKGLRHPSQPPPLGDFEGEGYAECPVCGKDYWLEITVRRGVIEDAVVDRSREGYIQ